MTTMVKHGDFLENPRCRKRVLSKHYGVSEVPVVLSEGNSEVPVMLSDGVSEVPVWLSEGAAAAAFGSAGSLTSVSVLTSTGGAGGGQPTVVVSSEIAKAV